MDGINDRLEDLFSTNRAPTEHERGYLKRSVTESNVKLEAINEQIEQLCKERSTLLEVIEPYQRALSPIRQVPDDILREIFLACLETRGNPTMSNMEAPVLLTQISSGMRRVALTTPVLWATIYIPMYGNVPSEFSEVAQNAMDKRAEGIKEWLLERSGCLPLSITVNVKGSRYARSSDMTQIRRDGIMDVILSCRNRWRNISFIGCFESEYAAYLTGGAVPNIRSLSLDISSPSSPYSQEIHSWSKDNLIGGPNLKSFSLSGIYASHLSVYPPVNWPNLTHLTLPAILQSSGGHGIDHVLTQTTNLISLNLSINSTEAHLRSYQLPFLEIMSVQETIGGAGASLLNSIDSPALQAFAYNMTWGLGEAHFDPLLSILKRSPNLTELSIGLGLLVPQVVECLQSRPLITHLHIGGPQRDDDLCEPQSRAILEAFEPSMKDNTACLCPQLRYFRCDASIDISPDDLCEFIKRKKANTPNQRGWEGVMLAIKYFAPQPDRYDVLDSEELAEGMDILNVAWKERHMTFSPGDGLPEIHDDEWDWPSKVGKMIHFAIY